MMVRVETNSSEALRTTVNHMDDGAAGLAPAYVTSMAKFKALQLEWLGQ